MPAKFTAGFSGVRIRILAIALIPSAVLLTVGVALAIYLAGQARHAKNYSDTFGSNLEPTHALVLAVEQERLQSLWKLSGDTPDPDALTTARAQFDNALSAIAETEAAYAAVDGPMSRTVKAFDQLETQLPLIRARIDAGTESPSDAYHFYSALLDHMDANAAAPAQDRNVPDPESTSQLLDTISLLHVVEAQSRAAALTVAATSPAGLPPALSAEFRDQVGYYHTALPQVTDALSPALAERAEDIRNSRDWQQLDTMQEAIFHPSTTKSAAPAPLPMSVAQWRTSADHVTDQLAALWVDQTRAAETHAIGAADHKSRNSLLVGAAMATVAAVAFLLSLWLANRLIGRLTRLRNETLALAEVQLPETVRRLAAGETIDPETQTARLDFGTDEIGSVANAFNRAYTAAVAAAITEARTRQGVRAVFLNIAHRIQVVVYRQLEILDEAERQQEDPALLDTFFRLDHLATRERRDAENLIILGGSRPGRQWRKPVQLVDLVSSAVAETRDYARVHVSRVAPVLVMGAAVADLIHLFAELIENATQFSAPQTRVDVTGHLVGKGVAIQINDQGVGMAAAELERANDMLATAPDVSIATISEDSRLGLFVVAQLGARHGISVRLSESDFGGVRAVVLIPTSVITDPPAEIGPAPRYRTQHGTEQTAAEANSSPGQLPLPVRCKQAGPAPEPAVPRPESTAPPRQLRSAEQSRDLMSAIADGTRRGRRVPTGSDRTDHRETFPSTHRTYEQE